MSMSWDEFKKSKLKEFGKLPFEGNELMEIQQQKEKEKIKALELGVTITKQFQSIGIKAYNIHKRSLPPGIDKIVVFNVTKKEGEWWIEHILKTKCYQDSTDDSKTIIYYDLVPIDAKPHERSIYHNEPKITVEEIPDFKSPRRIN